ncbi:MAG: thioredoxin family protein [Chloroflexi bacterium]|nr:thioredoxin family protein [Chloroflexota bacterium]
MAGRYGLSAVPTFLVFDGTAEPSQRFVGYPDTNKLEQALLGS